MVSNLLRSQPLVLILASVLFLGLRLVLLLTGVEHVSAEQEEWYRGTIAKGLIDGLKIPFLDYQAEAYSGGSLAVGVLAVPFFRILGPSLLALKLVPLVFSFAAFVLVFFFLRRYFNFQTALTALGIFCFAPPAFVQISLFAAGYHPESLVFSTGMLFALYGFLYGKERPLFFLCLLGFLGGLGFSFAYTAGVSFLACLLSLLFVDRSLFFSRRVLGALLLGFLVGLSPWWIYNSTHQFGGLELLIRAFRGNAPRSGPLFSQLADFPARVAGLLAKDLLFSFFLKPIFNIPPAGLSLAYSAVVYLLVVFLLKRVSAKAGLQNFMERRELPLVLHALVFVLVYSLNGFRVVSHYSFSDVRYVIPLQFFLLLLASVELGRGKKILGIFLMALGLLGQSSLWFHEAFASASRYRGYSYLGFANTQNAWFQPSPAQLGVFKRAAENLREPDRRFFYWAVAARMQYPSGEFTPESAAELFQQVPSEYHRYFYQSLGAGIPCDTFSEDSVCVARALESIPASFHSYFYAGLAVREALKQTRDLPQLPGKARRQDLIYRQWFYTGLGLYLYDFDGPLGAQRLALFLPSLVPEEKDWVLRGLGQVVAGLWTSQHREPDVLLRRVGLPWTLQEKEQLFWGIGWGLREFFAEDRRRALDWLPRLPEEFRERALQGLKAFEQWYGLEPS